MFSSFLELNREQYLTFSSLPALLLRGNMTFLALMTELSCLFFICVNPLTPPPPRNIIVIIMEFRL